VHLWDAIRYCWQMCTIVIALYLQYKTRDMGRWVVSLLMLRVEFNESYYMRLWRARSDWLLWFIWFVSFV
jgi:hypothetical protein